MVEKKVYCRPASLPYWWLKTRFATPYRDRTPLEEVIRVAIAWDMPYTYGEIVSMLRGVRDPAGENIRESSPYLFTLAERLFRRSQTVDWVVDVLGVEGLRKWYPIFKDKVREDLREEIERFYYAR